MVFSKLTTTTLLVSNLHCPSCITAITSLLTSEPLSLSAETISVSLLTGLVTFTHPPSLLGKCRRALIDAGYDVDDPSAHGPSSHRPTPTSWFQSRAQQQRKLEKEEEAERQRFEAHKQSCLACRDSAPSDKGKAKECVVQVSASSDRKTTIIVGGMTCASCVGSVGRILDSDPRISSAEVTLLPGRAVVHHEASVTDNDLIEMLEDAGFEGEVVDSVTVQRASARREGWRETKFVVEGMTCASCVQGLSSALNPSENPGIRSASVTLLPSLATIVHDSKLELDQLQEMIENAGFGAELLSSEPLEPNVNEAQGQRTVKLRIDGMFCDKCSSAINSLLGSLQAGGSLISYTPLSMAYPFTTISYIPQPPSGFTLRTVRSRITALGPFTLHPVHAASTLSTLAAASQARESRAILVRFLVTFLIAIPTFIIGIVMASLLPSSHWLRQYFEAPLWGSASRAMIALFILATPVQFLVGSFFYSRALKSLRGVWRRSSWTDRLLRWGSMDTLVALGTTGGYAASVAFLALEVRKPAMENEQGMRMGNGEMGYFDASVFLMLFILLGRYLEGISRQRTGDAIEALGKMKVETGLRFIGSIAEQSNIESFDRKESVDSDPTAEAAATSSQTTAVTELGFFEIGDTILIPSGSSVPLDSILLPASSSSSVDESSLTGEAVPVLKAPGDQIFAGTTNLGPSALLAKVTSEPGETMIDGIVQVVRDAMAHKAGIERIADRVTGVFVPFVVAAALITFGAWIIRGYAGGSPDDWLDRTGAREGGWALFAVQFAVAVLVVACPCGIGLAAPTAQMCGTGLAARLGIVNYGGGQSFQDATSVNVVVFDKTGTITRGEFTVAYHHLISTMPSFYRMLELVEDTSAHPISIGLRSFCQRQPSTTDSLHLVRSEELPGRGISAVVFAGIESYEVLVGNERLLKEHDSIDLKPDETASLIAEWGADGSSVVLVAMRSLSAPGTRFTLAAIFAVADAPRSEAAYLVQHLESQGIATYLCTGDNEVTARAIARKVGIAEECVKAGVLPAEKADFILTLQQGGANDRLQQLLSSRSWWKRIFSRQGRPGRVKVLFVGDGINDVVALTQADVGVSMGTGAAVALSSSDFCLLSSNLLALLTVLALSRATFRKILTNFCWAACFNLVLMPIAAGAFYDRGVKLPPVWASLAMALSSISVVVNSLLLRYTFRIPKAVTEFVA